MASRQTVILCASSCTPHRVQSYAMGVVNGTLAALDVECAVHIGGEADADAAAARGSDALMVVLGENEAYVRALHRAAAGRIPLLGLAGFDVSGSARRSAWWWEYVDDVVFASTAARSLCCKLQFQLAAYAPGSRRAARVRSPRAEGDVGVVASACAAGALEVFGRTGGWCAQLDPVRMVLTEEEATERGVALRIYDLAQGDPLEASTPGDAPAVGVICLGMGFVGAAAAAALVDRIWVVDDAMYSARFPAADADAWAAALAPPAMTEAETRSPARVRTPRADAEHGERGSRGPYASKLKLYAIVCAAHAASGEAAPSSMEALVEELNCSPEAMALIASNQKVKAYKAKMVVVQNLLLYIQRNGLSVGDS